MTVKIAMVSSGARAKIEAAGRIGHRGSLILIDGLKNINKIPELQKRILYSLLMLGIYRVGAHIPTPGIDTAALMAYFEQAKGSLLGLFDMFAGGALSNLSVFALGIMHTSVHPLSFSSLP